MPTVTALPVEKCLRTSYELDILTEGI
jgi:hypothetical protein